MSVVPPIRAERTGLVVFDMLERYRHRIERAGTIGPVQRLIAICRERHVPVYFARADHRADGADFARCHTDVSESFRPWSVNHPPPRRPPHPPGPQTRVLAELDVRPEDYDVPKNRWNAFHQTNLDLSLRTRDRDTILLVGGSTHVGIASTAFWARDADYQVVVVRDGCHGFSEQREFFMDRVFPRVCRVRTVTEVIEELDVTG